MVVRQGGGVLGEPLVGVVFVEGHTGLEQVHQGIAAVRDRRPEKGAGLFRVAHVGAGHERGVQGDGHGQGVERLVDHAGDLQRGDETALAGGRGLALGQAVDHVVVDDVGQVRVAADAVEEMVAALAVHVAVAALGDHGQARVARPDGRGRRQGPAVQPVEVVGVDVLGQLGRLADAGDEHGLLRVKLQLGQGFADQFEDAVVAAARAPGDVTVRAGPGVGGHADTSVRSRVSTSSALKARPLYLCHSAAMAQPHSARSRRANWPVALPSMTMIRSACSR